MRLALCAFTGIAVGFTASAWKVRADCAGSSWKLVLLEVSSSDPSATHRLLWPETANLVGGELLIRVQRAGAAGTEGSVRYLSARR